MKTADLLVVLGGESDFSRTDNAVMVHNEIGLVNGARIPIYLCGDHSGMNGIYLDNCTPQSEVMRRRALEMGVSDEYLLVERKRETRIGFPAVGSLDTFANFVFADDLIPAEFSEVGLFTEVGHMQRSLWCARKVFGSLARFVPFKSKPDIIKGDYGRFMESIASFAFRMDLSDVSPGDKIALQRYMETKHPYHALTYGNEPRFSLHGVLAKLGKITNARSKEKELYYNIEH